MINFVFGFICGACVLAVGGVVFFFFYLKKQIKSLRTPIPEKVKTRELVEKKAHKFLDDNFVNEIPPIEKMPLDETGAWIQIIEKLLYSTIEEYKSL